MVKRLKSGLPVSNHKEDPKAYVLRVGKGHKTRNSQKPERVRLAEERLKLKSYKD